MLPEIQNICMEHSWNCTPKWWKLLMWSFEFMLKTTLQKLSSKPVLGAPVSQWSLIVAWDDTPLLLQNWAPLKLNLTKNLLTSVRKFMTYLKHAKSSSFMVSNVDFHVPNGLGMDYEWMSRLGGGYLALTSALQTLDFTQSPSSAAPSTTCGYRGCSGC